MSTGSSQSAEAFVRTLVELGASHVVGLPDNATDALWARLAEQPGITPLTVTREGEAFAVASGLWIGGKRPVVCVQGTGLLESGDALRGTAMRMGVPLVVLVGYRGWSSLVRAGLDPGERRADPTTFTRPDVDSVALVLEPTLDAWGVPRTDELEVAWRRAHGEERPVAVLLKRGFE